MSKRALLIGLNKYYSLGELKYACQDAEAFAAALRDYCGFSEHEMTVMTCSSKGVLSGLSRYIEKSLTRLFEYREDLELFVFGFWGHGFAAGNGRRFLCGIDTDEDELERTAISLEVVKAKLAQVQAENTLLILDCCQNIPLGRGVNAEPMMQGEEKALTTLARDIHSSRRSQHFMLNPTVAVLNSCREGQKAYDWDERGHGIFTSYLLEAFQETNGSIASMAKWSADRVPSTALKVVGKNQIPYVEITGGGDFQLVIRDVAQKAFEHKASESFRLDRNTIVETCPQCGAPTRRGAKKCEYCESEFIVSSLSYLNKLNRPCQLTFAISEPS